MFHIIGLIFLFLFAILIIGVLILVRILRFFGIGKKRYNIYSANSRPYSANCDENKSSDTVSGGAKKKKVFDKDEGEYIDFEDV